MSENKHNSQTGSDEHGPGESRRLRLIRERTLDKTVEDSFPSSDPPSSIPNPAEQDDAA